MHIAGCYIMWLLVFLQIDHKRRFLQLCDEGTADISQFRELLRQGVDVNIYDEVREEGKRERGVGRKRVREREMMSESH